MRDFIYTNMIALNCDLVTLLQYYPQPPQSRAIMRGFISAKVSLSTDTAWLVLLIDHLFYVYPIMRIVYTLNKLFPVHQLSLSFLLSSYEIIPLKLHLHITDKCKNQSTSPLLYNCVDFGVIFSQFNTFVKCVFGPQENRLTDRKSEKGNEQTTLFSPTPKGSTTSPLFFFCFISLFRLAKSNSVFIFVIKYPNPL